MTYGKGLQYATKEVMYSFGFTACYCHDYNVLVALTFSAFYKNGTEAAKRERKF